MGMIAMGINMGMDGFMRPFKPPVYGMDERKKLKRLSFIDLLTDKCQFETRMEKEICFGSPTNRGLI